MKLNFWQILGILLVVLGTIGIAFWKGEEKKTNPTNPAPATVPQ